MSSNLGNWEKKVLRMKQCKSIGELLTQFGEPHHREQADGFQIWHYPLGVASGMLYSVHVSVWPDQKSQVYMHMEPTNTADSPPYPHSIFRWMPAAGILWLFGVIFGAIGILNIWLARLSSRGALPDSVAQETSKMTGSLVRGAAENGAIAALCILGWCFMRRRTEASLVGGVSAVAVALFITVRRWIYWQVAGMNSLPWLEPLFVWPFLLYVIVYGYRETRNLAT